MNDTLFYQNYWLSMLKITSQVTQCTTKIPTNQEQRDVFYAQYSMNKLIVIQYKYQCMDIIKKQRQEFYFLIPKKVVSFSSFYPKKKKDNFGFQKIIINISLSSSNFSEIIIKIPQFLINNLPKKLIYVEE